MRFTWTHYWRSTLLCTLALCWLPTAPWIIVLAAALVPAYAAWLLDDRARRWLR